MSTELTVAQENAKKQIGAMIEGVVMQKPELKEKLTMAIASSYLRLPDESFGWVAKGEMSREVKLMAIASHLQTGAMPGYGHIYFLGNKLYQSAAFIQSKANSDPNFNIIGEAIFEPFSDAEKEMFGIEKGDMACKTVLTIEISGKEFTATGHGIIDKDEISFRSSYGKPKPGMSTKKNRAMTLKTRAMRDLLSRFYPTNGVPVGPSPEEEQEATQANFTEQVKTVSPAAIEQVREEIKTEEAEIIEDKNKETAREDYKRIVSEARKKGIVNKDMLAVGGVKNVKYLFDNNVEDIYDILEVMQDYVDNFEPAPEPSVLANPHLESGIKRLALQAVEAAKLGINVMGVVGENHHNIIERGVIKEILDASNKLVNAMDKFQPADDPFGEPETKKRDRPSDAKKAYDKVDMLLKHPTVKDNKKVVGYLEDLKDKYLLVGDDTLIVGAGGNAVKNGDFTDLENILKERETL